MDVEQMISDEFIIPILPGPLRGTLRRRAFTYPQTYTALRDRLAQTCNMEPEFERLDLQAWDDYIAAHRSEDVGGFDARYQTYAGLISRVWIRVKYPEGWDPWIQLDSVAGAAATYLLHQPFGAPFDDCYWFPYLAALMDARTLAIMTKIAIGNNVSLVFNEVERGRPRSLA